MPGAAAAWPTAAPIFSVPIEVVWLAMNMVGAETLPPLRTVSVPVPSLPT